jgi:hypothetical protein
MQIADRVPNYLVRFGRTRQNARQVPQCWESPRACLLPKYHLCVLTPRCSARQQFGEPVVPLGTHGAPAGLCNWSRAIAPLRQSPLKQRVST